MVTVTQKELNMPSAVDATVQGRCQPVIEITLDPDRLRIWRIAEKVRWL